MLLLGMLKRVVIGRMLIEMRHVYTVEYYFTPVGGVLGDYREKVKILEDGWVDHELHCGLTKGLRVFQVEQDNLATVVFTLKVESPDYFRDVRGQILESIREYCYSKGVAVVDSLTDLDLSRFKYYTLLWRNKTNVIQHFGVKSSVL